jgi:hypothetical protein
LLQLQKLIDVIFQIMVIRLFLVLPRREVDGFGPEDLVSVLMDSDVNYLVILRPLYDPDLLVTERSAV